MRGTIISLLVILIAPVARGADLWVLQGHAVAPHAPCESYIWYAETLLFNPTETTVLAHIADVSSNATMPVGQDIMLPPHHTTSVPAQVPLDNDASSVLWAMHIVVPDTILAESRIEVENLNTCSARPVLPFMPTNGRMSFTVHHALQSANVPRIFLGADLGGIPSRNNVAIYNASGQTAAATVTLRRSCDDAIIDQTSGLIPANTVGQLSLRGIDPNGSCTNLSPPYTAYLSVEVDQPTVSWPSTIATDREIVVSYGTAANE